LRGKYAGPWVSFGRHGKENPREEAEKR